MNERLALTASFALTLFGAARTASAGECTPKPMGPGAHPTIAESAPASGYAGSAVRFRVTVTHGPGERALPPEAPDESILKSAGFGTAQPDAGTGVWITRSGDGTSSIVDIPVVLLPKQAGTVPQTLPAYGIKVARSSGEVLTICTTPHLITVLDPTSNTANAVPRPNPPPEREREEWTSLKDGLKIAGIALVSAAVGAYFVRTWKKRPKPLPPPPPPIPPWETANRELAELRSGPLVTEHRYAEFADAATDILRRYIGARYGFDGLESTSDEVEVLLRERAVSDAIRARTRQALAKADLAKFARATLGATDCESLASAIYQLVKDTTPETTIATQRARAQRRSPNA